MLETLCGGSVGVHSTGTTLVSSNLDSSWLNLKIRVFLDYSSWLNVKFECFFFSGKSVGALLDAHKKSTLNPFGGGVGAP